MAARQWATKIWTGEPTWDAHLRSAAFLDVVHHPRSGSPVV
jgi:polyisoprenoid-binding protein YceI